MTNNLQIAKIFNHIADILEIQGENIFRIRAYRRAAQTMENLTEDVSEAAKRQALTDIPGIGKDLAEKIADFLGTGKIEFFEKLKKEIPSGLLDLMTIPGIGPKTASLLTEQLKVKGIDDLEKKAKAHELAVIPGIQKKTEENILRGIELIKKGRERTPLGVALPLAEEVISSLKKLAQLDEIEACGSLRRSRETVRDIDILVTTKSPSKAMDAFVKLPSIKEVLAHGPTKSSAITKEEIQVDIRVVEPKDFGAALLYFTGSREHNVRLRELAVKKGMKINEYGIFDAKTHKRLGGDTEEQIYKALGLSYIEPELREDTGEIEKARNKSLPKLIQLSDIKGDFHAHTKASDGSDSIQDLAQAAIKRGYKYISITDHSKTLKVAHGQSTKDLLKQVDAIRKYNKKLKGFRVLASAEVDILDDGSPDFDDEVLAELDIVVASIHSGFKQSQEHITKRIVTAMRSKHVHIISHLTGRLIGKREAYAVNIDEVLRAAKDTNTALEINAFPDRLDLDSMNARRAGESGIMIAIGTDSHSVVQLENMKYGVRVARRAWLEARHVLNTYPIDELLKRIKKD